MSKKSKRKAVNRDPMTWYEVWRSALKVQQADFLDILNWSKVSRRKALLWIALSGLVSYLVWIPVTLQRTSVVQMSDSMRTGFLIGGALAAPSLWVLAQLFFAGTAQFVAVRLGGRGTFDQTLYTFAAFITPVQLITMPILAIASFLGDWVSLFAVFLVSAYQLLGYAVAILSVHDLPLQKAFASSAMIALWMAISLAVDIQAMFTP